MGTLELKDNDLVVKWFDTSSPFYYDEPHEAVVFTHVCPHQQGFIHHLYNIGDDVDFRVRSVLDETIPEIYYRAVIRQPKLEL
jgi:hypothetical protein